MKKVACSITILWIVLLFNLPSTFCLEKSTHKAINEKIALGSFNGFSLDTYLKNNLGFIDGTIEEVNGQKIFEWLKLGGIKEDEPFYTRSFNHFHNPLLPWDNAGYGGTFKSAILWAQDQGAFGSLFGGNYSWKAVRDYYYLGLTSSIKTDREKNLADTFRGLGQLMHLVEDMSVPAHTRNDGHVLYNYENWILDIQYNNQPKFSSFISNPIFYGSSIANISNLFDTDQYNGTNPDVAKGNLIGLSEYSNANFFSEDTMFTFPFPSKNTSVQVVDYDYPDPFNQGAFIKRQYYKKVADGETNQGNGYRLSGVDYLKLYRDATLSPTVADQIVVIPPMDEFVYSDYASLLLPRAVGYSAGLMNYFLRGDTLC